MTKDKDLEVRVQTIKQAIAAIRKWITENRETPKDKIAEKLFNGCGPAIIAESCEFEVSPKILQIFPEEVARSFNGFPLAYYSKDYIVVVLGFRHAHLGQQFRDTIEFLVGKIPYVIFAPDRSVSSCIKALYKKERVKKQVVKTRGFREVSMKSTAIKRLSSEEKSAILRGMRRDAK